MDIDFIPFYNLMTKYKQKEVFAMSNLHYINDLFKSLDLPDNLSDYFIPVPYVGSDSCFRSALDRYGHLSKFLRIRSVIKDSFVCPHCGAVDHHESKGLRKISLSHIANGHQRFIIEVEYRRYFCHHCHSYFKDDIPFQFQNTRMTQSAAQSCLVQFRENTAIAVIARMMGLSSSSVYRLFFDHVSVRERFYHLKSVISIDEFRATTDKGAYAFHIVDPITGSTLDIVEDRKACCLRNYFLRFPYKERKKVKIIVMDLSGPFQAIMRSLFPNAEIIADRFHYVKLFSECLRRSRLDICSSMKDERMARSIKRNLHLFDKYRKDLDDEKQWYDRHLKKHFTCRSYIEYIFDHEETDSFYESYEIYQNLLELIHEKHSDYKKELNNLLDHIFHTKNTYYLSSAKNIRKNWFMPILRSLTYQATYIRNGKKYKTSFNNGFIESMNNKVKLVKRNAYGYRYFYNLRKRILLHLGFTYEFK